MTVNLTVEALARKVERLVVGTALQMAQSDVEHGFAERLASAVGVVLCRACQNSYGENKLAEKVCRACREPFCGDCVRRLEDGERSVCCADFSDLGGVDGLEVIGA